MDDHHIPTACFRISMVSAWFRYIYHTNSHFMNKTCVHTPTSCSRKCMVNCWYITFLASYTNTTCTQYRKHTFWHIWTTIIYLLHVFGFQWFRHDFVTYTMWTLSSRTKRMICVSIYQHDVHINIWHIGEIVHFWHHIPTQLVHILTHLDVTTKHNLCIYDKLVR